MTDGMARRSLFRGAAGAAALAGIMAAVPVRADTTCSGGTTLAAVKKRGTLVAGVKSDYEPFGFVDEKGQLAGFDIDIVKYIAGKLGVGVDLRPVTSANRIPMLQSSVVDLLAASLTMTRERIQAIDFSEPYIVIGSRFLVKKGSGIKGYADLAGKTVAFTQGTPWGKQLQDGQPAAKPLVLQDKPQAVQAVLQGKAAAYIDDAAPLIIFAQRHPDALEAVGNPSKPSPMGIGLRPDDREWRNTVDFAVSDMWMDGTYAKTYQKFFGSAPPADFEIYSWIL
jgi:polar amino acid transport system substrate-binding protein